MLARALRFVARAVPVAMAGAFVAGLLYIGFRPDRLDGKAVFELVALTGAGLVGATLPIAMWLLTGMRFLDAWASRIETREKQRPLEF